MGRGLEATAEALDKLKLKLVTRLAEAMSYQRNEPIDATIVQAKADIETLMALQRQFWWNQLQQEKKAEL